MTLRDQQRALDSRGAVNVEVQRILAELSQVEGSRVQMSYRIAVDGSRRAAEGFIGAVEGASGAVEGSGYLEELYMQIVGALKELYIFASIPIGTKWGIASIW